MTYHHLSVLIHRQAEKYGDKVALKYRDYETSQWIPITWNKFSRTVRQAANALVALGAEEQRNIGIFSQNKPECLFTDFAAFANRLVTIPLYATSSSAQPSILSTMLRYVSSLWASNSSMMPLSAHRLLPLSGETDYFRPQRRARSPRQDLYLLRRVSGIGRGATPQCRCGRAYRPCIGQRPCQYSLYIRHHR